MMILMTIIFIVGYVFIAFEHTLKVNKAATALIMGILLWTIYITMDYSVVPLLNGESFNKFVAEGGYENSTLAQQCVSYIANFELPAALANVSSTLFFLLGAMTIVEMIDVHGGFAIITNHVTSKNKTRLLWIIGGLTFFMSSVLDNMTTAIVMIMMVRRLVYNYKERWVFAGIIIIAANSGGAWSPIGDITTILLWMSNNITATHIIPSLFIPSAISTIVPIFIASRMLAGNVVCNMEVDDKNGIDEIVTKKERISILILGVGCLLFVPVFKTVTHLPPYMGMLLALAIMWIYTELLYRRIDVQEKLKQRVPRAIKRIDIPTILFFLGLLLAVDALEQIGALTIAATFLETHFGNIYAINTVIGLLSSIVDNVPLVAAAISMYPIATDASIAASANPEFISHFVTDGAFWDMLAYCAGTGGSILIIGSVAGVVVMGIEKINFMWYLKNISPMAIFGYFAGILAFMLQYFLINGTL
ncbi:MAG: sodium:proton antiporter NhaD [Rikenellaceae bacterium]